MTTKDKGKKSNLENKQNGAPSTQEFFMALNLGNKLPNHEDLQTQLQRVIEKDHTNQEAHQRAQTDVAKNNNNKPYN